MARADPQVDAAYRVELVAGRPSSRPDQVRALWEAEGIALGGREHRRAFELLFVGVHARDGVVAECSAYLQRSQQLRCDLWHYRTFTAREHRMANVGLDMALRSIAYLEQRYVSGEDTRGVGLLYEVENRGLRAVADAVWHPVEMTFVGVNEREDHLRVRWFPGAQAPVARA